MNRKEFLRDVLAMDVALARHGVPALSPRWRSDLTRWAERGTRRIVIRAGRRSGKSLTICKLAIAIALWGGVTVPVGDVAWAVFISTTMQEALARLDTIEAFLSVFGVPCDRSGNEIRLTDRPLGFRVLACSYKSAVGCTAFFLGLDEMARWEADGLNPASEVRAAVVPMTATIPVAIELASSSPLSTLDEHYRLCADGDTSEQTFIEGPSWEFNPTLTEERCRALATSEKMFLREFAAIPQAAAGSCFDTDAIDRAFARKRVRPTVCVMVLDPSSGKKDTFSWGLCGRVGDLVVFDRIDGFEGSFWDQTLGDRIVGRLIEIAKANGVRDVHSDQRESLMLRSKFVGAKLQFHEHPWTSSNKTFAVERVRRWLADDLLVLPEHERLRKELGAFEERVTSSGAFTFGARGSGHDDYVALLLTAALADISQGLKKHSVGWALADGGGRDGAPLRVISRGGSDDCDLSWEDREAKRVSAKLQTAYRGWWCGTRITERNH